MEVNILEILYNKYGDFWVSEYYPDIENWSKWKLYSEWKNINSPNKKVLRSIFPEEIVLDIEDKNFEDIKKFLLELNLKFKIWDSGGRGIHYHLFFPEIKNYHESIRPAIKEFIIHRLSLGKGDKKKKDNKNLIGVEFYQHRKGQEKKLLFETDSQFYPENNLDDLTHRYIVSLPEKYEGNSIDGEIKPQIVFKTRRPCNAVQELIKNGAPSGERNKYANFIVQQLRDYCGYDFKECFKVLKDYNKNCAEPKEEKIIQRDLQEQFKRRYNINCNTLNEYCKWKNKEDCPQYKHFSGKKEIYINSDLFNKAITMFSNLLDLAERFYQIQPLYYDSAKNWWLWDFNDYRWNRVDETDLLNAISQHTIANTILDKNDILEALRQVGRKKKPAEPKKGWIQFKDKIIDIETNKEIEATYKYFITNPIPWQQGKSDATPTIDRLLEEWVGKDRVLTLKEIMAACTICEMPGQIHRIFCLIGFGRNGKTEYGKLVIKLVGKNNTTATELNKLLNSRFEVIKLYKKLMVEIGEIDKSVFKQTALLKALSGEDNLSGEYKGKDSIDFINYAKPIIKTNVLPETTDKSAGFFSRWCIVDFPNRFKEGPSPVEKIPDEEFENFCCQIPRLIKEVKERGGYWKEGTIEERQTKYEAHSNPIDKFIEEFCTKDVNGFIIFSEFYVKLSNYLKTENYRVQSEMEVSKSLKNKGFETKNKTWTDVFGTHNAVVIWGLKWQ